MLVLASCAKGKDRAAVEQDKTGATPPAQPGPVTTPTPTPTPGQTPQPAVGGDKGGSAGPSADEIKEATRNGAMLGPSAPTSAFDPLPEEGSAAKASPNGSRRGATVASGGGGGGGGAGSGVRVAPPPEPLAQSGYEAKIGAVTVDGKPAPDALAHAIRVRSSEVQACYTKTLGKQADVRGAMKLTFTVVPTGAITTAAVETTSVKNMELESCVVGVLQKIKLAKPLGTANIAAAVTITFAKR